MEGRNTGESPNSSVLESNLGEKEPVPGPSRPRDDSDSDLDPSAYYFDSDSSDQLMEFPVPAPTPKRKKIINLEGTEIFTSEHESSSGKGYLNEGEMGFTSGSGEIAKRSDYIRNRKALKKHRKTRRELNELRHGPGWRDEIFHSLSSSSSSESEIFCDHPQWVKHISDECFELDSLEEDNQISDFIDSP